MQAVPLQSTENGDMPNISWSVLSIFPTIIVSHVSTFTLYHSDRALQKLGYGVFSQSTRFDSSPGSKAKYAGRWLHNTGPNTHHQKPVREITPQKRSRSRKADLHPSFPRSHPATPTFNSRTFLSAAEASLSMAPIVQAQLSPQRCLLRIHKS